MTDRQILFSAPMVRALLAGTKTQTRRMVKPMRGWGERFPICKPEGMAAAHEVWWWNGEHDRVGVAQSCPYGVPGDRLWVRETWRPVHSGDPSQGAQYRADKPDRWNDTTRWRPAIYMPRWASRLTLKITDVRVERLNDISEADAIAEGIERDEDTRAWEGAPFGGVGGAARLYASPVRACADLWESINGPGSWAANPWVWAVTFEVETP